MTLGITTGMDRGISDSISQLALGGADRSRTAAAPVCYPRAGYPVTVVRQRRQRAASPAPLQRWGAVQRCGGAAGRGAAERRGGGGWAR